MTSKELRTKIDQYNSNIVAPEDLVAVNQVISSYEIALQIALLREAVQPMIQAINAMAEEENIESQA